MIIEQKKAKVLLYDLETSPRLVYVWGEYEQNVLQVKKESYILCFAYKWLGDKTTKVIALPDFKRYNRDKEDDLDVVKVLHSLQEEADICIGQNSDRFDNKWSNKQFLKHGLQPVYYKSVDTLKIAKKYFNFPSNRLDSLGEFLGLGRKVSHEGKNLWFKCMAGDEKAWKNMIKYAKQDVVLLEQIYMVFRPWVENHPNIGLFNEEDRPTCTKCGSIRVIKRGFKYTSVSIFQKWSCTDCYSTSISRKSENFKPQLK